jgi:hypothetical protein
VIIITSVDVAEKLAKEPDDGPGGPGIKTVPQVFLYVLHFSAYAVHLFLQELLDEEQEFEHELEEQEFEHELEELEGHELEELEGHELEELVDEQDVVVDVVKVDECFLLLCFLFFFFLQVELELEEE